jgi:hypothetical protein
MPLLPYSDGPIQGPPGPQTTDASLLTSGTLADARLSSNVSLDNINNNFTAGQSVTAALANTSALTASHSVTGTSPEPLVNLSATWDQPPSLRQSTPTAILLNVTDAGSSNAALLADLRIGGNSQIRVLKDGSLSFPKPVGVSTSAAIFRFPNNGYGDLDTRTKFLRLSNNGGLPVQVSVSGSDSASFGAGGITLHSFFGFNPVIANTPDTYLWRDAANILAQRNGTSPNEFRVFKTFTDQSNFERAFIRWKSNICEVGTESGGTGLPRNLRIIASSGVIDFVNGAGFRFGGFQSNRFDVNNAVGITGGPALDANYGCQLTSNGSLGWVPAANAQVAPDLTLVRDAANVLGQRRGTNAQTYNVYGTFTSASVFERLRIAATADRNQIISESTGGTVRPLEMSFNTLADYPTTANVTAGTFGVWKNTATGIVRLYVNDGGVMKFVALS